MKTNSLDSKTNFRQSKAMVIGIFLCIFISLLIFFRFVHPVVPWDGDDWSTIAGFMNSSYTALPRLDKIFVGQNRFLPMLFGTFLGYVAAFIVYPLTGDYVMSFVIVTAFTLALSITISLFTVYHLLLKLTESMLISIWGVLFFTVGAFLIFKTNEAGSVYLYWQYNYCTAYWYSIPSYLSSAFALTMISSYVYEIKYTFNFRTGLSVLSLYFLIFSFLPAAFLLAAVALCILLDALAKKKQVLLVICEQWFHLLVLIFFAVNLFLEFYFTFGMEYFHAPSGIGQKLISSLQFVFSTFSQMNTLFLIPAAAAILYAIGILLYKKQRKCITIEDRCFLRTGLILSACFLFAGAFYILFGTIDFWHICANGYIRMDTLYIFYFLLILISTLCLSFVVKNTHKTVIFVPLAIFVMLYTVISPQHSYSSSFYDAQNSTSKQRYEAVSRVVGEVQARDLRSESHLTVYVPYSGWGGGSLSFPMYIHHLTGRFCTVEFIYRDDINEMYFE